VPLSISFSIKDIDAASNLVLIRRSEDVVDSLKWLQRGFGVKEIDYGNERRVEYGEHDIRSPIQILNSERCYLNNDKVEEPV